MVVEVDKLWYDEMSLSEKYCIQGVVFIETKHQLYKTRGRLRECRPQ